MREQKISKRRILPKIIIASLITSVLLNISLISLYFLNLRPYTQYLKDSLAIFENPSDSQDCQRVYSRSLGKVICLPITDENKEILLTKEQLKSNALSECSKNFRENFDEKVLRALRNISDLEQLRELSIRMCMEERGFDY